MKSQHTARRRPSTTVIAGFLLIVLACVAVCALLALNVSNAHHDASLADAHNQAAAAQAKELNTSLYESAVAYNAKLAQSGQPQLGFDPFAADSEHALSAEESQEYLSQLNRPADSIMATISYPVLGIALPIYHGTASTTLEQGVGHMAGSSLPVGGANTRAVISAHSGLADKQMFDALQVGRSAQKSDVFYIHVLDRTLAYKVTNIETIQPDDFDALRIEPGADEVTLMTCTPYGVNTQRLLVTGTRAQMPQEVPYERDAPRDTTWFWRIAAIVAAVLVVLALAALAAFRRSGRRTRGNKQDAQGVTQRRAK